MSDDPFSPQIDPASDPFSPPNRDETSPFAANAEPDVSNPLDDTPIATDDSDATAAPSLAIVKEIAVQASDLWGLHYNQETITEILRKKNYPEEEIVRTLNMAEAIIEYHKYNLTKDEAIANLLNKDYNENEVRLVVDQFYHVADAQRNEKHSQKTMRGISTLLIGIVSLTVGVLLTYYSVRQAIWIGAILVGIFEIVHGIVILIRRKENAQIE